LNKESTMTKKRKAAAPGTPGAPPPVTRGPRPPAAPPPSSPPAPPAGGWPIYKLGEGHIVGGRSIRPGPDPVLRERDHDPLGIRSGAFDEGKGKTQDDFPINYGDVRKVCPY
jgi:hypothetical protein